MIKAILYDMDGTVLDTMPIYQLGWERADEAFGLEGRAVALLPQVAGMTAKQSGEFVREHLCVEFPYEEFRRIINETLDEVVAKDGISCKKGAPEIFETIRSMGFLQVLATSSIPECVFPYLKKAGIENAFDAVVTGDMVTRSKPDPEIFLCAARAVGCDPSECVVVEDASNGARAGIAAGIKTIMIPEYPPIPEDVKVNLWHECRDLSEIAALVAKERSFSSHEKK